jgi:probable selenium-dependent hydroxylase accessory protein YqeC
VNLLDAFDMQRPAYAFLIGGGGKTTLMYAVAREVVAMAGAVITTTSTRIVEPGPADSPAVVVDLHPPTVASALRTHRHVTVGSARVADDGRSKLRGLEPAQTDRLWDAGMASTVVVEADGSAGRPLKAHLPHEPVVSMRATHVIAVFGLSGLGAALDGVSVHRPELFAERAGLERGNAVTADAIARVFFHREGPLRNVAPDAAVYACVTGVSDQRDRARGRELADALRAHDERRRLRLVLGTQASGGRVEVTRLA